MSPMQRSDNHMRLFKRKNNKMKFAGCIVVAVLVVLAAIILVPLLMVWSINTLFNVQNPYDFIHWLAALVLIALLAGSSQASVKKGK